MGRCPRDASLLRRAALVALVVLIGCRGERRPAIVPRVHDGLAPWRYLVDEVAGAGSGAQRPIAAVGEITRHVLAALPTVQLAAPAGAPRSVPVRDGGLADLVLECPPELSGRPVALRLAAGVSAFFAKARLNVPDSTWCPAAGGAPLSVPLGGLPDVPTVSATIPVLATGEPAARVETRWLRPPADAVLEVTFGMANPAKSRTVPAARFEIRAEGRDGSSVTLLQRSMAAAEAPPRREWLRERVELASATRLGPEMRFVFETVVAEQDRPAFPVWGDPVILAPAPPPPIERRNIVLVSLDTLRADRLGCYGAVGGNTPTLDRLTSEGTLFEQAIAAAPWTSPSHATLLTGFHGCVHRLGIENRRELVDGIVPLPELLRDAGYATAAFTEGGYMHPVSFQRGFGTFTAPGEILAKRPWGDIDRTVGDAIGWLTREAREPFFLFVHTYEVHAPYNAPPPYGDLFRPDDGRDLASRPPKERARQDMARYDEEVRYTDSVMGQLLAALDALGVTRRTIVVIVADHGEAFGEHGYFNHVIGLDEEVLRVPFIWFAPGLVAASRRIPTVAGLIDVPSTLLDLVGLPAPPVIEGRSLAALLRDPEPPIERERERIVFAEQMLFKSPYPVVARAQSWRATFGAGGATDASLVGAARGSPLPPDSPVPALAAAARAQYEEACRRIPTLLPTATPTQPALPDPDQQERLRALGYVD
jgi:arylsulfatase A-like enzyme